VSADPTDCLNDSNDHRAVLGRLIALAGQHRRLVTPSEMTAERSIELGGITYPIGAQPPQLVNILDDLLRGAFVERVVPTAGASSYRPTELGLGRLDDDAD
jgi:hypothetical protein